MMFHIFYWPRDYEPLVFLKVLDCTLEVGVAVGPSTVEGLRALWVGRSENGGLEPGGCFVSAYLGVKRVSICAVFQTHGLNVQLSSLGRGSQW